MTFNICFKDFICFLERGEGKEKERQRHISVWVPLTPSLLGTWPETQTCALDWESNQRPFDSQACTQSTELHQPGLTFNIFMEAETLKGRHAWAPTPKPSGGHGCVFLLGTARAAEMSI